MKDEIGGRQDTRQVAGANSTAVANLTQKVCGYPDCGRPHAARGYCYTHWNQSRTPGGELRSIRSVSMRPNRTRTPEYAIWHGMKNRCLNAGSKDFPRYGGRGILVCDGWRNSFDQFLADMGPRPSAQHSIDRVDNAGNYEPGNCRWVTRAEQMANRRVTAHGLIEFAGESRSLTEWARDIGISRQALTARLDSGYSVERALTATPRKDRRRKPK